MIFLHQTPFKDPVSSGANGAKLNTPQTDDHPHVDDKSHSTHNDTKIPDKASQQQGDRRESDNRNSQGGKTSTVHPVIDVDKSHDAQTIDIDNNDRIYNDDRIHNVNSGNRLDSGSHIDDVTALLLWIVATPSLIHQATVS
ncbi:unnamed protein product [Clonostachys rosea]|uniref:Uncharacterized protein n=1 Tax=Bionectria ochroleuca TaxID=29856 RepID=A0ABY6U5Q4_BIOOC|nr:unnamed protein product [Clonostachys rosea]